MQAKGWRVVGPDAPMYTPAKREWVRGVPDNNEGRDVTPIQAKALEVPMDRYTRATVKEWCPVHRCDHVLTGEIEEAKQGSQRVLLVTFPLKEPCGQA